ncbi:MAG: hypothetical protein EBU08_13275 [Micrococcales bacterium]|jgi:hypothetical protein|nr:hypothetical protein [Micrococcales bacterium]
MYEDMGPVELLDLANQAEDMAHGLMQKAMDLRVQARNKQAIMREQGAKTWGATVRPYVLIDKGASE